MLWSQKRPISSFLYPRTGRSKRESQQPKNPIARGVFQRKVTVEAWHRAVAASPRLQLRGDKAPDQVCGPLPSGTARGLAGQENVSTQGGGLPAGDPLDHSHRSPAQPVPGTATHARTCACHPPVTPSRPSGTSLAQQDLSNPRNALSRVLQNQTLPCRLISPPPN